MRFCLVFVPDVNDNGRDEVVISNYLEASGAGWNASLWRDPASGTAPADLLWMGSGGVVAAADLVDGDGVPDLTTGGYFVSAALTGTIPDSSSSSVLLTGMGPVDYGDFTGDSFVDLVGATVGLPSPYIVVIPGPLSSGRTYNGYDSTFYVYNEDPYYTAAHGAGDLDGDGGAEFSAVTGDSACPTVDLFRGDQAGLIVAEWSITGGVWDAPQHALPERRGRGRRPRWRWL